MKRVIALVLAVLISAAVIAGCGSEAKNVELTAVMDKINSENGLSLNKLDGADKLTRYYNIDEKDVKQFAAEMDTSDANAPVEIVFVEAVDSDAAGRVEKALQDRYNSVLRTYTSYTPEKVDMVKACSVKKDGNFVSLIITDKASEIEKVYKESVN